MRLRFFTLILLSAVGLLSCRKAGNDVDIKTYDAQQMQSYIASNGITGMVRDTSGGDTTGTYYQIINPGSGPRLSLPDSISYVYTIRSFDGKFVAADTVLDHVDLPLGHVIPNGLQLGIYNLLKYRGGKMRILIPSHLAYGTRGIPSQGSNTLNNRLGGNQGLDYTIFIVSDQVAYDDQVIRNYMTANSLTGYTKTASGLYYKITTVGTGLTISNNSYVTANYVGKLMNNTIFDDQSTTTPVAFSDLGDPSNLRTGFSEGLKLIKGGGVISIIMPSRLAYGAAGSSPAIPANACLRFDITNVTVTNY